MKEIMDTYGEAGMAVASVTAFLGLFAVLLQGPIAQMLTRFEHMVF